MSRIWIKSSFSDSMNSCVDVSWGRSSFCDTANSCVEVGWTTSSRCSVGDCVQVRHEQDVVYVRDSKLGDDSPIQRWELGEWRDLLRLIKWEWTPEGVVRLADGCVEFGLDRHDKLTFDDGEWGAFVKGVEGEEFEPETLSRKFQSSSFGRGVIEEGGAGASVVGAPAQLGLSSPVAASRGGEPAAGRPVGSDAPGSDHAAAGADVNRRDTVPVAAELGSLNDELDLYVHPGSPAGRSPSTTEVDAIGTAVQPGSDAAGTGEIPPDPVPAARYELPDFICDALDTFHEEWAKAIAPLDGES
jgi:hypothetical protein